MTDREENARHLPDEMHYIPQMKVRTHLRGGANYPDMSGVCNTASPTPPTSGGTYPDRSGICNPATSTPPTSGVTYPDMSGVCA